MRDEGWGWLRERGLIERDPDQSSAAAVFVTGRGHEVLARGLDWLRTTERLDVALVPDLEVEARPHLLRGDLDMAVFAAMRSVDISLRQVSGLTDHLVGTTLAQEALRPGGPLHDPEMDRGEAVALMESLQGRSGPVQEPQPPRGGLRRRHGGSGSRSSRRLAASNP